MRNFSSQLDCDEELVRKFLRLPMEGPVHLGLSTPRGREPFFWLSTQEVPKNETTQEVPKNESTQEVDNPSAQDFPQISTIANYCYDCLLLIAIDPWNRKSRRTGPSTSK